MPDRLVAKANPGAATKELQIGQDGEAGNVKGPSSQLKADSPELPVETHDQVTRNNDEPLDLKTIVNHPRPATFETTNVFLDWGSMGGI